MDVDVVIECIYISHVIIECIYILVDGSISGVYFDRSDVCVLFALFQEHGLPTGFNHLD